MCIIGPLLDNHLLSQYVQNFHAPSRHEVHTGISPTRIRGMTGAIFGMTGAKGTACSEWEWRHRP